MRIRSIAILLVATTAGCATIEAMPPQVSEEPVRTTQAEVVRKDGAHGTIQQSESDGSGLGGDTTITIVASRSCDVVERPTVLRTTRTEFENKSAGGDWVLAVGGIGLAGAGIGVLVDQHKVGSTSTSSRTYNPIGPTGATAIGIGGVVLGATFLTISIADALRAQRVDVEKQEVTTNDSGIVRKAVPCAHKRYRQAAVTMPSGTPRSALSAREALTLGQTDNDGQLTVDLDVVIDRSWVVPSPTQTVPVFVADTEVGTIDLAALYKVREGRAFPDRTISTCKSPSRSQDCAPFEDFLRKYPDGDHAAKARRILDEAGPALQRLAEEESWRSTDLSGCRDLKTRDPDAIRSACLSLSNYTRDFPQGTHATEASNVLKKRRQDAVALMAEADRVAAEAGRKQKAEAAAIERKQNAEAAAERRQEAAKKALDKSDCVRLIQAECARISGRIPLDICIRRAMEAQNQCGQE